MEDHFYLDYNATTPLHPEVIKAMLPFLEKHFGNPSSLHAFGRTARAAIDETREELATLIGAKSKEIVFTSSGTESNNLAIFGTAHAYRAKNKKGGHLVTCSAEHHAVLEPCRRLETEGFEVTYLSVDSFGQMNLEDLARSLRPDTILVSVMSANNETGTRQPIREIGLFCRQKGIPFHCDAIQSFGKEKVNVEDYQVDLLSIAAHKFYGPKGAALLYVRSGSQMESVQLGGSHENERRAGTENVAAIVGMAKAAQIASEKSEKENKRLFNFTESLWQSISASISGVRRNGHPTQRLGNTLNMSFEDCDGDGLLMGLDLEGIAVSSGSACMVGSIQPSHVLQAMGVDEEFIRATVRFSLGESSKEEDLPKITERVARVVKRLRDLQG